MNNKMQVLYIKHTGHILGAFTRAADPEGKPSFLPADEEDHRSLLIRDPAGGNVALSVPATVVEQTAVDFEADVFSGPLKYMVTVPGASRITGSNPFTITNPMTTNNIVITSIAEVIEDTKVWVELEQASLISGDDPIRRVMQGEIKKKDVANNLDGKTVRLALKSRPDDANPAPIPTGVFYVLALVAGRTPLFQQVTAT